MNGRELNLAYYWVTVDGDLSPFEPVAECPEDDCPGGEEEE